MNDQHIYKVVSSAQWEQAESEGAFRGSGIDHADGFIHLSSADQVIETVKKHFAGQANLVLVTVDSIALGETLRWETSRNNALFPHVYGVIPMSAVIQVVPLPRGANGLHQFPEQL